MYVIRCYSHNYGSQPRYMICICSDPLVCLLLSRTHVRVYEKRSLGFCKSKKIGENMQSPRCCLGAVCVPHSALYVSYNTTNKLPFLWVSRCSSGTVQRRA